MQDLVCRTAVPGCWRGCGGLQCRTRHLDLTEPAMTGLCCPLHARTRSLWTDSSAVSVKWNCLYADCLGGNRSNVVATNFLEDVTSYQGCAFPWVWWISHGDSFCRKLSTDRELWHLPLTHRTHSNLYLHFPYLHFQSPHYEIWKYTEVLCCWNTTIKHE